MEINEINIATMNINAPPRQFLDGLVLPMGTTTLLATGPGCGKSTSLIHAAVALSFGGGGTHEFFGMIDTKNPWRVCVLLAEETSFDLQQKFAHNLKKLPQAQAASSAGNLLCMSLIEINESLAEPQQVFGQDGSLTPLGVALFAKIEKFKPEVVILDTLSAMSEGEYANVRECYNAVKHLNVLAKKTGAAIIMTTHITKDSGKTDKGITHSQLMGLMRGSGALAQATRNSIVMIEAPEGRWSNIGLKDGDKLFAATVKGNVDGPMEGEVFPVIRSKDGKTFKAMLDGVTLADASKSKSVEAMAQLRDLLPLIVECAAVMKRPFSNGGKMSIEGQYESLLGHFMPSDVDKFLILNVLEDLVREGVVLFAKTSQSASVLDVPLGLFADPNNNLDPETGKPFKFEKGAVTVDQLTDFLICHPGAGRDAAMRKLYRAGETQIEIERMIEKAGKKEVKKEVVDKEIIKEDEVSAEAVAAIFGEELTAAADVEVEVDGDAVEPNLEVDLDDVLREIESDAAGLEL